MENQSYEDMNVTAEVEFASILDKSPLDSNVDIDKTLNDKAKKNQLTKNNVKNLIKNVLMNDDVATMLRQTLDDDKDANCLYEPKLTRAKIREMLKTYPPSVHQWSPNQQQSIISECRLLIEKEFADDSEDEEYRPDKTLEDDDDDDDDEEFKCTEINKLLEMENITENDADISENDTVVGLIDKETIGMRTRSKFSLNDTPLEIIEQAFIPPDITEDMYDSVCENDEWMEFLSDYKKPLESVQNDDAEDDPEYNVLCDDDFSNVDKEEFRIDKSVKVTRKEYNNLMNELYEFTESYIQFNGKTPVNDTVTITESDSNNKNVANVPKNSNQSNNDFADRCELKSTTTSDKSVFRPKSVNQSTPACNDWKLNVAVNNKNNVRSKSSKPSFSTNYSDVELNITGSSTDKNEVKSKAIDSSQYIPVNTSNLSNWKSSASCSLSYADTTKVININKQLEKHINEQIIDNQLEKSKINFPMSSMPEVNLQSHTEQCENYSCDNNIKIKSDDCKTYGMSIKQIILFKQQLTQHVQLTTQNYLLCTIDKQFQKNKRKFKHMLDVIKNLCKDKKYEPINIHTSLVFIQEWNDAKMNIIDSKRDYVLFPTVMKEFMLFYDKPVFIYPQLLPTRTYHLKEETIPISPFEERFLVCKIDYLFKKLKESRGTRARYRKNDIYDLLPMILKTVQKRWFSHRRLTDLKNFVTRRKNAIVSSVLKEYLMEGEIEEITHVVDIGILFTSKYLLEYDISMFPPSWRSLVNSLKK